jgi:threonylcarbamoyladenosine tRNA methylthiotransferase MtaB
VDGCDYKCTYCTIPLARGISRSDELNNVLKNAKFRSRILRKLFLLVNIEIMEKGNLGTKTRTYFLELVQELDKVEGIERLRISSIEPNLLKNETIEFVSKSRTLYRIFISHSSRK